MIRARRLNTLADRVFGDVPWWFRGLITLQVAAILTLAVGTALRVAPLSGPDEAANASYVQIVAEHHRLPIQDVDCLSLGLRKLQSAGPYQPCGKIAGSSYEAFQPPLYYVLAAPVWLATPGVRDKVYAVRLLDCVLLAVAMLGIWWLCREALGRQRSYGLALALCGLLIPAVIVEQTFVGNDALELALVPFVLTACLRAARRPASRRSLVLAAVLVGATLLTKLTSVYLLIPFAATVLARANASRDRRAVITEIGITALIPLVILAPWLADNLHHYSQLTANGLAHAYQLPVLNPTHEHYTWAQIPALDRTIVANYLPKLCGVPQPDQPGEPLRDPVSYLALAALVLGSLVLLRRRQGMAALCTLLPIGVATITLDAARIAAQQYLDLARFLHPTIGPFGVGVALLAGPERRPAARGIAALAAGLSIAAIVLWIQILPGPNPICP